MSEKPALSRLRRLLVDRISSTEAKKADLTNRPEALAKIPGVSWEKVKANPGIGSIAGQNLLAFEARLDSGTVTCCNLPCCRVQLAV
jgi:hypothetical protein